MLTILVGHFLVPRGPIWCCTNATTKGFSRALRMGKKPGRAAWGSQQWEHGSYSSYPDTSWQFWPGAWSPQDKSRTPWTPATRQNFPAYDDQARVQALAKTMALPSAKGKGKQAVDVDTPWESGSSSDSITQILQDSINATRKQEQKVRSLAATRARKHALWERYVSDMKQTLQREHARHQKEMERIDTELQTATQAQEHARAHLRRSLGGHSQGRDHLHSADGNRTDGMGQHAGLLAGRAAGGPGLQGHCEKSVWSPHTGGGFGGPSPPDRRNLSDTPEKAYSGSRPRHRLLFRRLPLHLACPELPTRI